MSGAPKRIWACEHMGDYGRYYPEAVDSEGEYGGTAVEYTRTDLHSELVKAADDLAEASEKQFEKLTHWLRKPTAIKAMKSLEADDAYCAALSAYQQARANMEEEA